MPESEIFFETFGYFLTLIGVIFAISFFVRIVLFILQGFGLYEMSKTLGLENPWISFIPIVSVFSLGRVAQHYIKRDGNRSAKFSIVLIVLLLILYVLFAAVLMSFVFAVRTIVSNANIAATSDSAMTLEMFYSFISVIIFYFLVCAVIIAYDIAVFVALWRVYSIFDSSNATTFTVLSIFFPFLTQIFLFAIRKKAAKLTYEERIGIERVTSTLPIE